MRAKIGWLAFVVLGGWMLLLGFNATPLKKAHAGDRPLPTSLLFTTGEFTAGEVFKRNMLVLQQADTLETALFYQDKDAELVRALSWSPTGELLAIYRVLPADDGNKTSMPRQLCLLDRTGKLKRCFDETPPRYTSYPDEPETHYPISWSADGSRIYFLSEHVLGTNHVVRRIVEADVSTGQTLRTLYEQEANAATHTLPAPVSWAAPLQTVVVGVSVQWDEWRGYGQSIYLLDLNFGQVRLELPEVMPPETTLEYVCPQLSPHGDYLVARVSYNPTQYAQNDVPDVAAPFWFMYVVVDQWGTVQATLGEPQGANTLQPPLQSRRRTGLLRWGNRRGRTRCNRMGVRCGAASARFIF